MKKKYIKYRLGLFISLCSLSMLSSCVNTKQRLGLDNTSGLQEQQGEHSGSPLGMNDTSREQLDGQQEEQGDNRDSTQDTSRLQLIRNNFWSIVRPLGEIDGESLIGMGESLVLVCAASYCLGHCIGYHTSYGPGYAAGLLNAYAGPGI